MCATRMPSPQATTVGRGHGSVSACTTPLPITHATHPGLPHAPRSLWLSTLVHLGVLPREEELFARDRAHGFEHDYAPDPYRR